MDFRERRNLSENHRCSCCDLGDEMVAEIERLTAENAQLRNDLSRGGALLDDVVHFAVAGDVGADTLSLDGQVAEAAVLPHREG